MSNFAAVVIFWLRSKLKRLAVVYPIPYVPANKGFVKQGR